MGVSRVIAARETGAVPLARAGREIGPGVQVHGCLQVVPLMTWLQRIAVRRRERYFPVCLMIRIGSACRELRSCCGHAGHRMFAGQIGRRGDYAPGVVDVRYNVSTACVIDPVLDRICLTG